MAKRSSISATAEHLLQLGFVIAVSGKSWRCYVCDSAPLKPLVSYCSSVLAFVESLQEKDNVKVASVKQKHSSRVNDDLSSASTSDVDLSVFTGGNVPEVVKLLKSSLEPLLQVIAETEELIVKDSPSADSSNSQQIYDTVAAKLKTEFVKSTRALSAVKRVKLPADIRNCTVDVERLGPSVSEETDLSRSRRSAGNSVADADVKLKKAEGDGSSRTSNSVNSSSRASRDDIEAQRDLHQQMLSSKDESSESDTSSSSESSTSSSEDADPSSSDDDEYDPKSDIRQVKLERGRERRTTAKKQKMRAGN